MRTIKKTLIEFLVLAVVGVAVAFVGNGMRARGALSLTKNYFDNGVGAEPANASPLKSKETLASRKPLAHPYQEVTLEQVMAVFKDPNTQNGLNVFVDARKSEDYEAGHIPGAIQADHYQLEKYLEAVMERASAADKVIVYCTGGECEDSIFMCADLLEAGLSKDVIFLFPGGWKEWEKSGMPIAKGRGE